MCDVCGCGDANIVSVDVHHNLLSANDHQAAHLRAHFGEDGITAINLMGSPGSGKTALLEATAHRLTRCYRMSAVSGDLATTHDADRLARAGVPSHAITTGTACHLDARMIEQVLHGQALGPTISRSEFFFIENVGNLVCPAIYDLGQAANVVALSVTEGVDKPLKYPVMFKNADLVVITKIDLLPHLPGFSLDALMHAIARVMPRPRAIRVSTTSGEGLDGWIAWLESTRTRHLTAQHVHGGHASSVGHGHAHAHDHDHR